MRILAIDPGGTTGWASWDRGSVHWGQLSDGVLGAKWLAGEVEGLHELIIERYTIGERTVKFSRQSDALEITGGLKWEAARWDVPVVMQQPRDAMRLFTDERLKQFGWYAPGEQHARDALRHMGFYLARKRIIRLTGTTGGTDG